MLYELTEQNIRDGKLSEEEFSSGLGYHVPIFDLRAFPYSEELLKAGKLSPEQIMVRGGAIYKAMHGRGLIHNGSNISYKSSRVFAYEDAEGMASTNFPAVRCREVAFHFSGNPPWSRHYWLINRYGLIDAHDQKGIWIGNTEEGYERTRNVFPGIWDEIITVISCRFKKAAFTLLDRDTSPKNYWANSSKMAPEILEKFPTDTTCFLESQLHEKRHLHQITIESHSPIADYYAELDADMAAIASFQKADIGKETILAMQHTRYMCMLHSLPKYWFAAAMQDLCAKKEPENVLKVQKTVCEIRLRIANEMVSKKSIRLPNSQRLQHDIKIWDQEVDQGGPLSARSASIDSMLRQAQEITSSVIGKNPAPVYSAIHRLLDQGVFTDPFTQRVAQGIVDAARYFNPDLVKADNAPSRARLEDRLRSGGPKLTNG